MTGLNWLMGLLLAGLLASAWPHRAMASERPSLPDPQQANAAPWRSDYAETLAAAEAEQKLALLWFVDERWSDGDTAFERVVLREPGIAARLSARFVAAKLLLATNSREGNETSKLLDHAAFAEMQGQPGFAILDMTDKTSPLHRRVVSILPFRGAYPAPDKLAVLLDLPQGTLTQRTLIYAIRTHRERPASTAGEWSPLLAHETASHSTYQARIALQGHHQWESRFHAINAKLPGGLLAQEVCAESWPGQSLLDAAIECVDSWRQSPGHWEAVRTRPEFFGYDMQRGRNGVWYATGIFARRQ